MSKFKGILIKLLFFCLVIAIGLLIYVARQDMGISDQNLKEQADKVGALLDSYGGAIVQKYLFDQKDMSSLHIMVCPVVDPYNEQVWFFSYWPKSRWLNWLFTDQWINAAYEKEYHADELKNLEHIWSEVRNPIELFTGDRDDIAPVANRDFLIEKVSGQYLSSTVIKEGGHFILWENVDEVKKSILSNL